MVGALILAVICVGGALLFFFNQDRRIKRALRKAAQVDISNFRTGSVGKIVGTLVYSHPAVTAPLTGRQCAYYEVTVEEQDSHGSNNIWHEVICEAKGVDFLLKDASGSALVLMQHAQVVVVNDSHSKSGSFDDATEVEQAFLNRHGLKSKGWVFNKTLRYREGVLEQGESIAVLGRGQKEADPDPNAVAANYRGTSLRLVMRAEAKVPMLVSDEPSTVGGAR